MNKQVAKSRSSIKIILSFFLLLSPFAVGIAAQDGSLLEGLNVTLRQDEKYGEAARNTFDIILPKSEKPTALVIFVHGGGFVMGDKKDAYRYRKDDIRYFLEKGVAFATVNYQYISNNDSVGVGKSLNDVKTALQFIRFNAKKYNLNKKLIGIYGGSAGAGSSLFLGFHDDLAVKKDKTLLGESTRVKCVGALETQATYNLYRWLEFIPTLDKLVEKNQGFFYNAIANFYGFPNEAAFAGTKEATLKKYDMLDLISTDDPPTFVLNMQKETDVNDALVVQHHRAHALVLKSMLDKNGVKNIVNVYSENLKAEKDLPVSLREFMVNNLR